jgi:hypothetical protein
MEFLEWDMVGIVGSRGIMYYIKIISRESPILAFDLMALSSILERKDNAQSVRNNTGL